MDELIQTATRWLADDPDPETRAATRALIEARDEDGLRAAFGSRLQFGTAGIRGPLGAGPARMNRVLVRRVCTGLARYLLEVVPDAKERGVVIGYDGRKNSTAFAEDSAAILAAHGIPAFLYEEVVPTPVLAHAIPELNAAAGIMVTASHNPPSDNGYKVYWGNGAQIIPPHDARISKAIDAVVQLPDIDDLEALRGRDLVRQVPAGVNAAYLDKVLALRVHENTGIEAVYTAMHGVGWATLSQVLERAGHHVTPVPEQRDPDADFPTVSFPNPEEKGALDLAKTKADEVGAELIVANDPDADRLAVAVRDGTGWTQLTGNQVGQLLAEDLLTNGDQSGDRLVATTIVSSTMLSRIAEAHGASYDEYLTGFKWIANGALEHEADGGRFVMGYEEAIGYSVGPVVRDKDGISATLLFLDLASAAKAEGKTLFDLLTELYRTYGFEQSLQHSVKLPGQQGADRIKAVLAALRESPPDTIGGIDVVARADVLTGVRTDLRTGDTSEVNLPSSNVLAFYLEDGSRILARPSGTEPKIKFYFEVRAEMGPDDVLAEMETKTAPRIAALKDDLLKRTGLG